MKNVLLTLVTAMAMGSLAQANEVITQVLRFGEDLQITVLTRSTCHDPKPAGTLKLVSVSQEAAVYSLELTPNSGLHCAPGDKEAVVEVQVPSDFKSKQLVIVSGGNVALTEEE